MAMRPLLKYSPTAMASKTVVMPDAAIWASWAKKAGSASGQTTFGRGIMYLSRLSVCSSTRPGMSHAPSQSTTSAPSAPQEPPTPVRTPSLQARSPSVTLSGVTSKAFLKTVFFMINS